MIPAIASDLSPGKRTKKRPGSKIPVWSMSTFVESSCDDPLVLNLYFTSLSSSLAFTIFSARLDLNFFIFSMTPGSPVARIWAARIPAFIAPSSPTVATGIPGGICRILRMESHPSIEMDALMGTPITGSGVSAAMTPGRCAAPPAPAIITMIPLPAAFFPNAAASSGVRCADKALISNGISNSSSNFAAFSMMGRSDVLPIIILTLGFIGLMCLKVKYQPMKLQIFLFYGIIEYFKGKYH
jgi:hypothetical protein